MSLRDQIGGLTEELGSMSPYRITRVLAESDRTAVLEADEPRFERKVLLKWVCGDDLADLRRLGREAQLLAGFAHPNVVRLLDVVTTSRGPVLVYPFETRVSLMQLLRDQPRLPWRRAVRMAHGIAEGLCGLHEAGIVHRDVKPANVIVLENDHVRLIDLGLAKSESSPRVTISGEIVGTPLYVPPEMVLTAHYEARSDLYSLGLILYEMLAGKTAFRAADLQTVLNAQVNRDLPPLPPGEDPVPAEVGDLIDWLTRKNLESRPGTAREVADLLAKLLLRDKDHESVVMDREARTEPVEQPRRRVTASTDPASPRPPATSLSLHPGRLVVAFIALFATGLAVALLGGNYFQPPPVPLPSTVAPASVTSVIPPQRGRFSRADVEQLLDRLDRVSSSRTQIGELMVKANLDFNEFGVFPAPLVIGFLEHFEALEALLERHEKAHSGGLERLEDRLLLAEAKGARFLVWVTLVEIHRFSIGELPRDYPDVDRAKAFQDLPAAQGARSIFLMGKYFEELRLALESIGEEDELPDRFPEFFRILHDMVRMVRTARWDPGSLRLMERKLTDLESGLAASPGGPGPRGAVARLTGLVLQRAGRALAERKVDPLGEQELTIVTELAREGSLSGEARARFESFIRDAML